MSLNWIKDSSIVRVKLLGILLFFVFFP